MGKSNHEICQQARNILEVTEAEKESKIRGGKIDQTILDVVQKICNRGNGFGNQLLYDCCKDSGEHPWGKAEILSDKIWLIGRAYAASPERRYYRKDTAVGDKIESRGDGTSRFFRETAEHILNNPEYLNLCTLLKNLELPYCFDGGATDRKRLQESITAVALYNEMVKAASVSYDKEHNQAQMANFQYRNMVSYCSKFLHFHAPHGIFISDHFTKEGARFLCSPNTRNNSKFENCNAVIDASVRKEINAYAANMKIMLEEISVEMDAGAEKALSEYVAHCIYSYCLGCFLRDRLRLAPENPLSPFPRMTDSVFQAVKRIGN